MSAPIAPIADPAVPDGYRPGACNIGSFEIRRRRLSGLLGVGVAAVLGVLLVATGAPPALRLVVALPLWGGALGLLQARRRFCAAFALRGIANLGTDDRGRTTVADDAARRADLGAARRLVRDAFLLAAVPAAVFALLPVG